MEGVADGVIPVPEIVAQRAWECACDLYDSPGPFGTLPPVMEFVADVIAGGPERITWSNCRFLFMVHRQRYGEAAQ